MEENGTMWLDLMEFTASATTPGGLAEEGLLWQHPDFRVLCVAGTMVDEKFRFAARGINQ